MDSQNSDVVTLMVMVYYSERIQIKIIQDRESWTESRKVPCMKFPITLSMELQTALSSLATICDKARGVLPDR